MEFGQIIDLCMGIFNLQFSVLNITITLWQLFIFMTLATILLRFVFGLMR